MTKIKRRFTTVTLYQGDVEEELQRLLDAAFEAARAEETAQKRMSTRSESMRLAAEHDERRKAAEAEAVTVTVWALRFDQFDQLQEAHPARDDQPADKMQNANMATFPRALMFASLVDPDAANTLTVGQMVDHGQKILGEVGEVTRGHFIKLEKAAWGVNVGDADLPKESLVTLLRKARGDEPEPRSGQE